MQKNTSWTAGNIHRN